MCVAYQNVCLDEYIISSHCIIFIWAHLDAWIIVARVLYDVNCCLFTELGDCLFHCILCVHPMSMSSTCVLNYIMPSLQGCNPCIFVSLVLSASRLCSRVLVVTVLLGWICYIMMLRKPAATSLLCIIWRCSVRMFCTYSCSWSINAIICNYGVP